MHWRRASAIAAKDRRPAGPAAVFVIFHPARLTDCIDMAAAQRRSGLKTCSDTLATARGGKTAFFSSLLLAGLLGTWANGILVAFQPQHGGLSAKGPGLVVHEQYLLRNATWHPVVGQQSLSFFVWSLENALRCSL
ncbi:uncharacterized protein UV8b_03238 [Ustilaginoidea virens]|uniref:Uncharacterized protein n=1 Tax=Ustilaginoidea virens TaxID=1159556 RepID=A0A8E5MGX4_USTVR|nr:uncharacterized protein UV8b_03238 [Ustilaginoidea virens]QUC18997.1 hypothetical protein UV8b_03238 [Ustilaginoidea virens]